MSITQLDSQDLRHAALGALAARPRAAFTAAQVKHFVQRQLPFDPSVDDVSAALEFLAGLAHAEKIPDPYGSEEYWRITSEGVLAHERSRNA